MILSLDALEAHVYAALTTAGLGDRRKVGIVQYPEAFSGAQVCAYFRKSGDLSRMGEALTEAGLVAGLYSEAGGFYVRLSDNPGFLLELRDAGARLKTVIVPTLAAAAIALSRAGEFTRACVLGSGDFVAHAVRGDGRVWASEYDVLDGVELVSEV